jgi:phage portal protein BeeE
MDMTRANYNSLELIGGEFKALTLVPWCERWRGEVRKKLFTQGERRVRYDVRFNYDAFLRADRKTRYDAHRIGITSGFLTRNEARIEEGMTPLDGGDDLLTPLNMVNPNDPNAGGANVDQSNGDSKSSDQESGDSSGTGGAK